MAETEYNIKFNEQEVLDFIKKFITDVEHATANLDEMSDAGDEAFTDLAKGFNDVDNEAKKYLQTQIKANQRIKNATQEQRNFRNAIRGTVGEFRIFGRSINDITDSLGRKQQQVKGLRGGLSGLTKGAGRSRLALGALGGVVGGVLVAAFGSLTAFLTRTQKGIDIVAKATAGLQSIFDNLIDRAAVIGEALFNIFNQPFLKTVKDIGGAFKGLGDEIQRDLKISNELSDARVNLRESERALNLEYEKSRANIEELRNIGEDQSKSALERSNALQEALKQENSITERRIALAEENLRIIRTQNSLSNSTAADLDKEAAAEAALAQIRRESAGQRREVANQLRSIQREEINRVNALREAYSDLIDELEGRVTDANLSSLLGVDRLEAERKLAIAELNRFVDSVRSAAQAAGRALPEGFEEDIRQLFQQIDAEFRKNVDALRKGDPLLDTTELLQLDTGDLDDSLEEGGQRAIEALARGADKALPLLEQLKADILDALNISEAELGQITDLMGSAFGNIINGFDILTQSQLDQQDRLIDSIQERIDKTQSLLDEELNKAAQGYANDSSALKAKLEEDQQARTEAEAKRLEVERRAARQRLIQNGLEQASNLVLAVTKLAASEASKGLVGIITAVTGASLIFGLIAQARAQAAQFSEVPAFKDGTPYVHGPGGSRDDKVHAMLSTGERVVDARNNSLLGSISNDELVKGWQFSQDVQDMIQSTGALYPVMSLAPYIERDRKNEQTIIQLKQEMDYQAIREAHQTAANDAADKMIDYWKTRPIEDIIDGKRVIQKEENGVIHRKTVKNP